MLKLKLQYFGHLTHHNESATSWLIGKDPDAGKDWGQEEKGRQEDWGQEEKGMAEDEMVG